MSGSVRLSTGSTFAGEYKVVRPLVEGETRCVYAVEQLSTGREFALKVLASELVPDRDAFVAEVRVGGKIATEHLVDVRGAGFDKESGLAFIVMELLEGASLAKHLAEHTDGTPLPDWDEILSQMLRGLSAVHAAGVVHGGLLPETVFLAVPGISGEPFRIELLDLGIPKAAREVDKARVERLEWLAPEQVDATGKELGAQTDVWTVGLLTFAMMTGRRYWKGATQADGTSVGLSKEILTSTIEPASARAKAHGARTIPTAAFDAWFAKCVARDPAQRWPNAAECLEGAAELLGEQSEVATADIEDAPDQRRGPTRPPPLPPMVQRIAENPKPAILAIVVLVAVALAGGFGLSAVLRPGKEKAAQSTRAKAIAWARADKAEAEKACDGGDATACHGLGLMLQSGLKVPKDEKKAVAVFTKACGAGDGAACASLAGVYMNGEEGQKPDPAKAASFYRKACDGGEAVSCADLAEMHQTGNGVAKDEAQAKVLFEKACKAGYTEVCKP